MLTAAVVAGIDHGTLPLIGETAPLGKGLRGAGGVIGAAGTLAHDAAAHPALLIETTLLTAVAFALPHVVGKGLRWSVGLGAAMLAATLLALPVRCAVLALRRAGRVFGRRGGVLGASSRPKRALHSGSC